ncbi:cell envelope integrity protein CreD [Chitinophaga nivalis]|uniref:Cell envelope integrity protein CreD n=1 Tax=Chitinophaga nivalis TaxID=2991709 RepID=A0ABT3IUB7_9BACT|nr:cell envelope integrity protein CreD [Chitinophaga nivalis]MCW3462754.1 cell envelope integrity protein CreD [Chitinophaga nivalis]MCW3487556.1 cell envelope integrity protein CreD [Chitinophaga nivalis]
MEPSTHTPLSFFDRYAYAIKAFIIIVMTIMLLIPANMIQGIIWERRDRQQEATKEVSSRWGEEQHITGPVLAIPYTLAGQHNAGEFQSYVYLLPENLKINGELLPEKLKRGIFDVAVYTARLQLSGTFTKTALEKLDIPFSALKLNEAMVLVGISDLRGIDNQVQLMWNGKPYFFNPGIVNKDLFSSGIQTPVAIDMTAAGGTAGSFTLDLGVKGSGHIRFSPIGQTTVANIRSTWPDPSFDDAFPPKTRQVSDKGFVATWQIQHLSRNYPQSWTGNKYDIQSADFGIRLFMPAQSYQQSMRAVKYALLIIGLTFFILYFIELSQRRTLHPLQYALVGLALCIFYTLLISISEQLNFIMAYIISSVLTIGLIVLYIAAAYKNARIAISIGSVLVLLYGFIYVVISAEDQALLMGSLGLFIILALVMYFSSRIKWDKLGQKDVTPVNQ